MISSVFVKFPSLLVALFSLGSSLLPAQDAPPVNLAELLSALKEIEQTREETLTTDFANLTRQVQAAASSPTDAIAFYEQAVAATDFQGRTRENTLFQEWKKKNIDKLRDKNFQASLQLHLRYLALTIRAAAGEKRDELARDLINYTADVLTLAENEGLHEDWLGDRAGVDRSIFIKALGLQGRLKDAKEWEMNPGNVDGIFDKILLPELRKAKDARTLVYWDRRISLGQSRAEASDRRMDQSNFVQVQKPQLQWMRAKEYLHLDQPNRALQEMFAVIKTYPGHANFSQWIRELREALSARNAPPAPQSAEPAPEPAATPSPDGAS